MHSPPWKPILFLFVCGATMGVSHFPILRVMHDNLHVVVPFASRPQPTEKPPLSGAF